MMSRSGWVRTAGLCTLAAAMALSTEDAGATTPSFAWVCAEVACGDWGAADQVCAQHGQTAQEMTCSSEFCEEGNRIHCAN